MAQNKIDTELYLWEVFVQDKFGEPFTHCGSVHASDSEMALQNARDAYSRRNEAKTIWIVKSSEIISTTPSDDGPFFEPSNDKIYRHPQFYTIPKSVKDKLF